MIKELENDINSGSINHAYFLECDDEVLGLKEAKEFAEKIFAVSNNESKSKSNSIQLSNNPDCSIITGEEKSIKVDAIREMQRNISIMPLLGNKKVYIIPSANKMNVIAQNCLLKTLEEPPKYAIIILIASSIYSVIGTVSSRVKRVKIQTGKEFSVRPDVKNIIDTVSSKGIVETLKFSCFFEKNKDNIIEIFHEMMAYCDEKIQRLKNELPQDLKDDTINIAKYVFAIDLAERRINGNSNFAMTIDEMLLSFKE